MTGMGSLRDFLMFADGRKAQRDRYVQHRADLLFQSGCVPGGIPGIASVAVVPAGMKP